LRNASKESAGLNLEMIPSTGASFAKARSFVAKVGPSRGIFFGTSGTLLHGLQFFCPRIFCARLIKGPAAHVTKLLLSHLSATAKKVVQEGRKDVSYTDSVRGR
jgi:hypothetical protein